MAGRSPVEQPRPAPAGPRRRGWLRRWPPGRWPPGRWPRTVLALAVPVVLVLGLLAWAQRGDDVPAVTAADVDRAVREGIEAEREEQRDAPPDAAVVYRTIEPSLVSVDVDGRSPQPSPDAGADAGPSSGLGAGVVVRADGSVLTALHVVDGAAGEVVDDVTGRTSGSIRVTFADGTQAGARVVEARPEDDIAVLAVDSLPEVLVPAVLGGGVQVGDAVFAVGHPFGLRSTLTAGVVSALDRSVATRSGAQLEDLIQFDAAVNPGNSGGPLLDRDGRVVGIVTGLVNPAGSPSFVGVGFAVPIATAGGAAGGPQK